MIFSISFIKIKDHLTFILKKQTNKQNKEHPHTHYSNKFYFRH